MKLRTELREQTPLTCDFDALKHDAAAARALMQALVEVSEKGEYVFPTNALIAVKRRADKLMRSWGFDAREDA